MKEERAELKAELNQLLDQRHRITNRIEQIRKQLDFKATELTVSQHAVDRYRERIMDIPPTAARKILNDPQLLEKHKRYGEGTYVLSNYPNVLCVVSNWTVVTCYNRYAPEEKLKSLGRYMDYYIDKLCHRVDNPGIPIKKFKQFRKDYYK
ncbi:hypothetical protein ACTJJB_01835 [Chitinophaga sp. 22536]|uniref:hypothetical protein n=1 Tax=unclassified Chitinophaga TaxID=2619133 RepID=UPI003F83400D